MGRKRETRVRNGRQRSQWEAALDGPSLIFFQEDAIWTINYQPWGIGLSPLRLLKGPR